MNIGFGELQDIVSRQTDAYFSLKVGFGRVNRALAVRRARFLVRCRARGSERRDCAVRAYVKRGGRKLRVGVGKSSLSGRSARVRLRLNGRGRRVLRARGSKSLRVLARGPGARPRRALRPVGPPLRHQVALGSFDGPC